MSALPARRIIPCLDVKDGRVVKGVQFRDHRDAGDIVEQAMRYRDEGADELVFYDISASAEGRTLELEWVRRIARGDRHPVRRCRRSPNARPGRGLPGCGADKVSINSPAIERPELIDELARDFGSQCVVLGVDSLFDGPRLSGQAIYRQFDRDAGQRDGDAGMGARSDRARRGRDRAQLHAQRRRAHGL